MRTPVSRNHQPEDAEGAGEKQRKVQRAVGGVGPAAVIPPDNGFIDDAVRRNSLTPKGFVDAMGDCQ